MIEVYALWRDTVRYPELFFFLLYSFHPIAEITSKNANMKDELKGANTRIKYTITFEPEELSAHNSRGT